MFKSVFAKYIITFMLIIFISFLVLVSIVTGMVNSYAVTSKQQTLSTTAHGAADFLGARTKSHGSLVKFDQIVRDSQADIDRMLSALSGTTHKVVSGIAVCYGGKTAVSHEVTEVTFRPLSESEINAYIDTGEPFDKAGSYGLQDKASVFVEKINGDYFNVVGLPVYKLNTLVRAYLNCNLNEL